MSLWLRFDERHDLGSAVRTRTGKRLSSFLQCLLYRVVNRHLLLALHAESGCQRIHLSYQLLTATQDIRLKLSSFLGITQIFAWKFAH